MAQLALVCELLGTKEKKKEQMKAVISGNKTKVALINLKQ